YTSEGPAARPVLHFSSAPRPPLLVLRFFHTCSSTCTLLIHASDYPSVDAPPDTGAVTATRAMVEHDRTATADVPARDGVVSGSVHAATRLRAPLPGLDAGLPRGRPAVRRDPDRARLRGRWR